MRFGRVESEVGILERAKVDIDRLEADGDIGPRENDFPRRNLDRVGLIVALKPHERHGRRGAEAPPSPAARSLLRHQCVRDRGRGLVQNQLVRSAFDDKARERAAPRRGLVGCVDDVLLDLASERHAYRSRRRRLIADRIHRLDKQRERTARIRLDLDSRVRRRVDEYRLLPRASEPPLIAALRPQLSDGESVNRRDERPVDDIRAEPAEIARLSQEPFRRDRRLDAVLRRHAGTVLRHAHDRDFVREARALQPADLEMPDFCCAPKLPLIILFEPA